MTHIFKNALLSTIFFGIAIASGFAMDNNPPNEPVKKVLETETIEEVQPSLIGYGYKDTLGNCVLIASGLPPTDCSTMNPGDTCTVSIGLETFDLYLFVRESPSHPWVCVLVLRKPI